uniref:Uncharacterized protein n=1 Tax=Acrobeloides nanus TaxID=290746 RepID=A0A914CAN0_9BILA
MVESTKENYKNNSETNITTTTITDATVILKVDIIEDDEDGEYKKHGKFSATQSTRVTIHKPKVNKKTSEIIEGLRKDGLLKSNELIKNSQYVEAKGPDGSEKFDANFVVIKTTEEEARLKYQNNQNEVYKNLTNPRGLALIIDNLSKPKRPEFNEDITGSKKDLKAMKRLLNQLGYETITEFNLDKIKMQYAIDHFGQNNKHQKYDSCVIAIMTHGGTHDKLHGANYLDDPNDFVIMDDLLQRMNSAHAEKLKGKPKIFIIQACRGKMKDRGMKKYDLLNQFTVSDTGLGNKKEQSNKHSKFIGYNDPSNADIFVVYATSPGTLAFGHKGECSWFLRSICEVFSQHSANDDILTLVTKVNNLMSCYEEGYKQISHGSYTLRRKFFFNPTAEVEITNSDVEDSDVEDSDVEDSNVEDVEDNDVSIQIRNPYVSTPLFENL